MGDPYLYPDSEVMINLGDFHDEQELEEMEADYTTYRLSEMVFDDSVEQFDFEDLCTMHYHIFQDVYEWAGKPRIINIEKAEVVLGELSIEYSDCFDIANDAHQILKYMQSIDWKSEPFPNLVEKFSDCIAKLWKVHPFREGNTRTIITFVCMFIEAQGIYIASDLFKENASYMRDALVAANAIFHDLGDLRKREYLHRIIQDALERGREMKQDIIKKMEQEKVPATENNIHKVVLWNRKSMIEHTGEEIRDYLEKINLLSKLDEAIDDLENGRVQTIEEAWEDIDTI